MTFNAKVRANGAVVTVQKKDGTKINVIVGKFVPVSDPKLVAAKLISNSTPNNLKVGDDNKLVSQPDDIDFLAYYILGKS